MMAWVIIGLAVLTVLILFAIISRSSGASNSVAEPVDVDWDAFADERVQDALNRGRKIEAIKVYREQTGVGLKDAKEAIEYAMASGVPVKKRRHTPSIDHAAGVRDLLDEGRRDEAVELYARFAGVDQYTAQDAVDQIEREMRLGDAVPEKGLSAVDEVEIRDLLAHGNKIEAVKRYRELSGLGLKEAKDAVDAMQRGMS